MIVKVIINIRVIINIKIVYDKINQFDITKCSLNEKGVFFFSEFSNYNFLINQHN